MSMEDWDFVSLLDKHAEWDLDVFTLVGGTRPILRLCPGHQIIVPFSGSEKIAFWPPKRGVGKPRTDGAIVHLPVVVEPDDGDVEGDDEGDKAANSWAEAMDALAEKAEQVLLCEDPEVVAGAVYMHDLPICLCASTSFCSPPPSICNCK